MNHPPAIFSLLDTSAYGGAESYLLSNLFFLAKSGHPVYLATNCQAVKEYVRKQQQSLDFPLTLIDFPFRLDAIGNWKGLLKFFLIAPLAVTWLFTSKKKYLDQHPQVTALLPGFSDRLFFSPWLKRWGYRLLWLEYGPLEPTFKRNFGFPKWLYFATKHMPDLVVTISEWTKNSLLKTARVPATKIKIIYPGVQRISTSIRTRLQKNGQQWRKKYNVDTVPLLMTLGRLATEKEFELVIKALTIIAKDTSQSSMPRLVVVGDGPEQQKLENRVREFGLKNVVTFLGFCDEELKQSLLATTDLFIFPSAWPLEGFGMTTIEAMNWGVPVITTGFGPQAEIIENNKTGFYFKARDQKDLAKKISSVLKNKKLATIVGQRGQKKSGTTFSALKMHQAWASLI